MLPPKLFEYIKSKWFSKIYNLNQVNTKKATFPQKYIEKMACFFQTRFPTAVLTASGSKGIISSPFRTTPAAFTYSVISNI